MGEAEQYIKQITDEALKNLTLDRSTAMNQNRNSARGVNTMRALDLAAYEGANRQEGTLYSNYAQKMANLMTQEAGMENQQDQMVMQGEQARDLADRQDKDAFYSAKGEGLQNIGKTVANAGAQFNNALERNDTYDLLGTRQFSYNRKTGKIMGVSGESLDLKQIDHYNLVKTAWDKGVLAKFKTLEEAQAYYKGDPESTVELLNLATNKN